MSEFVCPTGGCHHGSSCREALCGGGGGGVVFRVVWLVNVAMVAAIVPVSRAAEWINSWLLYLKWAGVKKKLKNACF